MYKLLKIIVLVVFLCLAIVFISHAQTLTYQEALDSYTSGGCSLQSQTRNQICFTCTNLTPYPECESPINMDVVLQWTPAWDGIPDCVTECEAEWDRATDMSCICDVVCVPDGSCNAAEPACEQTTTGTDNCGNACTKIGEACPPEPTCEDNIAYCTTEVDCTTNNYYWYNNTCNIAPQYVDLAGQVIEALSGNYSEFIVSGNSLTTEDLGARIDDNSGPRASYIVNVPRTGTWYIWIRGTAPSGASDSFHYGLDGTLVNSITLASYLSLNQLPWARALQDESGVATMQINTLGTHTIDIWQREDGASFDAILLTDDEAFTP